MLILLLLSATFITAAYGAQAKRAGNEDGEDICDFLGAIFNFALIIFILSCLTRILLQGF